MKTLTKNILFKSFFATVKSFSLPKIDQLTLCDCLLFVGRVWFSILSMPYSFYFKSGIDKSQFIPILRRKIPILVPLPVDNPNGNSDLLKAMIL